MNEVVGRGLATSAVKLLDDLRLTQVLGVVAVKDVSTNIAREENRLLLDDGNLLVVPLWVQ